MGEDSNFWTALLTSHHFAGEDDVHRPAGTGSSQTFVIMADVGQSLARSYTVFSATDVRP